MKSHLRRFRLFVLGAIAALAAAFLPTFALAQAQPNPAEYKLGAGDVVKVTVYQNPDLSLETRISEAGVISYPLLGSVRLGGLTPTQAEKAISDGLRTGNFVKQPQVTMLVTQVRGNLASVLGNVNRPGRYPIEMAELKLTDLLAIAGGSAPNATDVLVLTGTRNGRPYRAEIDLVTVFTPSGRAQDVLVQNGDVLWVDRAPVVYIYGEVQRPGAMRLERSMTVMQALATGGGLTQRGTEKGLRVHRRGPDGKVQVVQPTMDDQLLPNDVVYVRESLF